MSDHTSEDDPSDCASDPVEDSLSSDVDTDTDGESTNNANLEVQDEIRTLSFGALASAHEAIRKEHHGNTGEMKTHNTSSAEKLQAIRDRLAELRNSKDKGGEQPGSRPRKGADNPTRTHRLHKHAPTEISSKRAVTRKRPAIEISSNPTNSRDPRFLSVHGRVNEDKIRKNYAFLNEYRQHELGQLKAAIKKAKTQDEKDSLKMELTAMENRQRAEAERERERTVLQEHRKKEKQLVREGKSPFYLKRSEQKRQALVAKFEAMKGKERTKAIERRRKKESQREKRNMPAQRRTADEA